MRIRPGCDNDYPRLRQLFLDARKASWGWLDGAQWRLDDFDAAVKDEQLWVAECGDALAGFASVWVIDSFLHNLFVDPQWQGKGVGSLLLEQVQRSFSHGGTLKCLSQNENALRFYQHHGWKLEAQGASPDGDYWLMRYPQP
jgi:Acetyltransferases